MCLPEPAQEEHRAVLHAGASGSIAERGGFDLILYFGSGGEEVGKGRGVAAGVSVLLLIAAAAAAAACLCCCSCRRHCHSSGCNGGPTVPWLSQEEEIQIPEG